MIAAAAVLIVLFIMWDVFRPNARAPQSEPDVVAPVGSATDTVVGVPTTSSQGTTGPATPATPVVSSDGHEPSYIDLLARSETRRRIRGSGNSTYLGDMLAVSEDSMLRRWDNRSATAIRVWFAPTNAANFKPVFLDAIRTAFTNWTSSGVPVRFDFEGDSSQSEVIVKWRIQFEIERTGQTDVTWDENGHIQSAVITLATFDPKGRPMESDDIRVVATHEVGHLIGLDHSRDSTDLMFPTAKVRDLSDRDVRTAVLLYQLSPGSLR
jgi:hypothetical protein